jgi:hypothetical protein
MSDVFLHEANGYHTPGLKAGRTKGRVWSQSTRTTTRDSSGATIRVDMVLNS